MRNLEIPGDGTPIENMSFMESNADEIVERYSYQRILTDEEIDHEKDEFAAKSILIAQLEEEKTRIMTEINERLKVQKSLATKSLTLIRVGRMEVSETVYLIKDEHEGKIGTYTSTGELLSERALKPTERQRSVFTPGQLAYKTGTDSE